MLLFRSIRYMLHTTFLLLAVYFLSTHQNQTNLLLHSVRQRLTLLTTGQPPTTDTPLRLDQRSIPFFIHRASAASPTCSITAPANLATVSSTTSVTASATGSSPLSVQFLLDGGTLNTPDTSSPYTTSWNTTGTGNGSHALSCTTTNQYGETTTGASISVTVSNDTTPPVRSAGSPSSVLASGTTATTLSLTTNENATCKYSLSSGTAYASMGSLFVTTGGTSHATAMSGLTDGNSYTAYVRCQDSAGNANTTDYVISFSVANPSGDVAAPTIPSNVSAAATSVGTVDITWTASTDNTAVSGYKVFRDGNQVGTVTGTSYTDSGLTPATSYSYEISAYDAAANESAHSSASVAMTDSDSEAPTIPSGVAVSSVSATAISISWTASTDNASVLGYKVFRDGNQVGTTMSTSYTNTGLTASTSYSYEISAYDAAANESVHSSALVAETDASVPVIVAAYAEEKEKKVEIIKPRRTIKASPKLVQRGTIQTQFGRRFSKNAEVLLFFEKPGGRGYYPPLKVKTDRKGTFSILYRANKPAGDYRWYAVEPKTGRKSRRLMYTVFESKQATYYAAVRKQNAASASNSSSSSRSTHSS